MVRQPRIPRTLLTAAALAVSAAGLAACGDGVDVDAVPRIGGERFEEIRFNELYRPPGATVKETTTVDLVVTESLSLDKASPESVVTTYGQVLTAEGWSEVQEPQAKRDTSWFGAWSKLGRNVVVVAEYGDALQEGAPQPTDFTLSFQRPTKNDQITGIGNDPITES